MKLTVFLPKVHSSFEESIVTVDFPFLFSAVQEERGPRKKKPLAASGESQSTSNKDAAGFKLFQPWAAHSARQLSKRARETMMSRSAFQAVPLRHAFITHPNALAATAFAHSPLAASHLHGSGFMGGMVPGFKAGSLPVEGIQSVPPHVCRPDLDNTLGKGGK